jgi:hypothetical protein
VKDRLVAVRWEDVRIDQADSLTREEIMGRRGMEFTTLGILLRDDDELVAVANEVAETGTFRGVTYILRPLVRSVTPLGEWPPRARRPKRADHPARDGSPPTPTET